ncbi:MAG TPA: YggT family protein [Candidatus Limnocylindrales bacterium]|nr:YggT family protein [Candidatus Limnocylindrales bacterium]
MAVVLIFVKFLVIALYVVLLGRVLMSWINPRFDGPVGRFLYETTEPILAPIRRLLPQTGMIDFSPLVAFLLLSVIAAAIGLR